MKNLDLNTVLEIIRVMRNGNKEFQTNTFFSISDLRQFIEVNNCIISGNNHVIVLSVKKENCTRIHFFSENLNYLHEVTNYIITDNEKPIMIDVIGKREYPEVISQVLNKVGFKTYIKFGRWLNHSERLQYPFTSTKEVVEYALISDLDEIYSLLKTFDLLAYEIPSKERVADHIVNKEIFIVHKRKQIAGFFILGSKGDCSKVIDWTIVRAEFRGNGIAKSMYQYAMEANKIKTNYSFYAEVNNLPTIRNIESFGFTKDNFSKIILVK